MQREVDLHCRSPQVTKILGPEIKQNSKIQETHTERTERQRRREDQLGEPLVPSGSNFHLEPALSPDSLCLSSRSSHKRDREKLIFTVGLHTDQVLSPEGILGSWTLSPEIQQKPP
jgi:hypothetical protein